MKNFKAVIVVCGFMALVETASVAANPEAPGMYDARNMGMGGAGVAHLETPAAIIHNPANLVNYFEAQHQGNITLLNVKMSGSFAGADNVTETDWLPVPLPFVGFSRQVGEHSTTGAAFYLSVGFGGGYEDIKQYGVGNPCTKSLSDVFDIKDNGVFLKPESAENDGCTKQARDEIVNLAVFELAVPFSYRISEKVRVGAAIRFPFGIFEQQTTQDIFGAFNTHKNPHPTYGLGFARVNSEMFGYGDPGILLGITYEPFPFLSLAATYRSRVDVTMKGDTDLDLNSNLIIGQALDEFGGLPIGQLSDALRFVPVLGSHLDIRSSDDLDDFLDRLTNDIDSEITWSTPKAIELGMALWVTPNLLFAADWRHQYHKSSNKAFIVKLKEPIFEATGLNALGQQLNWKDVYGWSLGWEYLYSDNLQLRAGYSFGNSATPESYTNAFTPPPSDYQDSYYLGFGYTNGKWQYDFALSYAKVVSKIDQPYKNGEPVYTKNCQPGQLVKSGCPGYQDVTSIFIAASANFRY